MTLAVTKAENGYVLEVVKDDGSVPLLTICRHIADVGDAVVARLAAAELDATNRENPPQRTT